MRKILMMLGCLGAAVWANASAPVIAFDDTYADFGVLPQGTTVQFSFRFTNKGDASLHIEGVQTTCGCTAAAPENPIVPPGERGAIQVTFDSRGKMGETFKQVRVRTNDPKTPLSFLTVTGRIVPSQHPEITGPQNLFTGSCRECHVDRGVGKAGKDLFMSSCAMCHESQERGGPPIAPSARKLASLSEKRLRLGISEGVPSTSMPGYGSKKGGPLSKSQIRSLVHYLKSQEQP
jgi:cytochrome c553